MKLVVTTDMNRRTKPYGKPPQPVEDQAVTWMHENILKTVFILDLDTLNKPDVVPPENATTILISDELTDQPKAKNVIVFPSVKSFLQECSDEVESVCVVGGESIYNELKAHCTEILHTVVIDANWGTDDKLDLNSLLSDGDWVRDLVRHSKAIKEGGMVGLDFFAYRKLPDYVGVTFKTVAAARPCTLGDFKKACPRGRIVAKDIPSDDTLGGMLTYHAGTDFEHSEWVTEEYYQFLQPKENRVDLNTMADYWPVNLTS